MKKPLGKKMEFFRQYDEVLFNQLEKKFLDLETANGRLQRMVKNYNWQFENISDVVFMIGTDFNILNISKSVEKLLGYKAEDFIGKPVSDLRHIFTSESFERAITHVSRMLKGEKIPITNYDFVAKDGTIKHIEIHGSPLIRDGKVAGTISVARDITERIEAEFQKEAALEALQKSEDKYRALIETTDTGYVIMDQDGLVRDANSEYVRLTGHHDLGEIIGRSVIEWTAESEKEKNAEAVKACFDKGYIRNFEIDYVDSKGNITPIEINATCIEIEGKTHTITICRDITERKQMEEKLRASEEKYRHLYNNVPAAIYKVDFKNGKLSEVNDVFYKHLGFSKEEITSLSPYDLLTEESRKLFMERVGKMTRGIEVPTAVEYEIFNKKGERLWMRLDNDYIYDTEGQVIAANVVAHDITERKKTEHLLRDLSSRHEAILESAVRRSL